MESKRGSSQVQETKQETKQEKDDKETPLTKEQEQKLQSFCDRLAAAMNQSNEKQIIKRCEEILSEAKEENLAESLVNKKFEVTLDSADSDLKSIITGTPLEICFAIAKIRPQQDFDTIAKMLLRAGSQSALPAMKSAVMAGHYPQVKFLLRNFFTSQLTAAFAFNGISYCPPIVAQTVSAYIVRGSRSDDKNDDQEIPDTFAQLGMFAQNEGFYRTYALLNAHGAPISGIIDACTLGDDGHKLTLFEATLLEGSLSAAADIFIRANGNVKVSPVTLEHRREPHDPDCYITEYADSLKNKKDVTLASYDGTLFIREHGKTILHLLAANPAFQVEHCQRLLNLWHNKEVKLENNPQQRRHLAAFRRAINQLDPEGYTPIMRALATKNGAVALFLHRESLAEFTKAQQNLQFHKKLAELFKQISQNKDHLSLTVNFLGTFHTDFLKPAVAKQVLGEKLGLSYDVSADKTLKTFLQSFLESGYIAAIQWYITLLLPPLPEKQAADETKSESKAAQESKTVDAELRKEPSDHMGDLLLQLSALTSESKFVTIHKFLQHARNLGSLNQRADFLKLVCNLKNEQGFTVLMHIITYEYDLSATKFYCEQSGKSFTEIAKEIFAIPDLACAAKFFALFANGIVNPAIAHACLDENLGMNLLDRNTGKSLLELILESHNVDTLKLYLNILLSAQHTTKEIKETKDEKDDKKALSEAKRKPEESSRKHVKEPFQDPIKFLIQELEHLYENPGSYAQPLSAANMLLQAIQDSCVPEICQHPVVLKHTYRIKDSMDFTQIMRDIRDSKMDSLKKHVENMLEVTGISYAEVLQDIFAVNDLSLAIKFITTFLQKFKDPSVTQELIGNVLMTDLEDRATKKSLLQLIVENDNKELLQWYITALFPAPAETKETDAAHAPSAEMQQKSLQHLIKFFNSLSLQHGLKFLSDIHVIAPHIFKHSQFQAFLNEKDDKGHTLLMRVVLANKGRSAPAQLLYQFSKPPADILQDIFLTGNLLLAYIFLSDWLWYAKNPQEFPSFPETFLKSLKDPLGARKFLGHGMGMQFYGTESGRSLLRIMLDTNSDALLEWYLKALLAQPSSTESKETKPTRNPRDYLSAEISALFKTMRVSKNSRFEDHTQEATKESFLLSAEISEMFKTMRVSKNSRFEDRTQEATKESFLLLPNRKAGEKLLSYIQKIAPDFVRPPQALSLLSILDLPKNPTTINPDETKALQARFKEATQLFQKPEKPAYDPQEIHPLISELVHHYWSPAAVELVAELIVLEGIGPKMIPYSLHKRCKEGDFLLAQRSLLEKPHVVAALGKDDPRLGEQVLWPIKNNAQEESKEPAKTILDVALEMGEKHFTAVLRLHVDCYQEAASKLLQHGANTLLLAIEKGIINPATNSECYKLLANNCQFFWGDYPEHTDTGSPRAAGSLLLVDAIKRENSFALETLLKMRVNSFPWFHDSPNHSLMFHLLKHYEGRYDHPAFNAKVKCLLQYCKTFDKAGFVEGNETIIFALKQHQEKLVIEMLARRVPLSRQGLIWLVDHVCADGKLFIELLREKSKEMQTVSEQKTDIAPQAKIAVVNISVDPYAHFLRQIREKEGRQFKWEYSRILVRIYDRFIKNSTDPDQINRAENLIIELLTEDFPLELEIIQQLFNHKKNGLPFLEMLREKSDLTTSAEHKREDKQQASVIVEKTNSFTEFLNKARAAVSHGDLLRLILETYLPHFRKELGDLFDKTRWPLIQEDFCAVHGSFDPIDFVLTHKCFDMVIPLIKEGAEIRAETYIKLMRTPELKNTPICQLAGNTSRKIDEDIVREVTDATRASRSPDTREEKKSNAVVLVSASRDAFTPSISQSLSSPRASDSTSSSHPTKSSP